MPEHTGRRHGGPRNLLYLTDAHDECDEAGCVELLCGDDPAAVDVLMVTFTGSVSERLAAWKRHAAAPPARVGVVSVATGGAGGGGGRPSVGGGDRPDGGNGPTVRRVSDPSDLTGVGIAISEFLAGWADNGTRTVVCFDSLTALLQYVDERRVFQFCNEITSKVETAGAEAHFHLTPAAHDRQVLSVLGSLFDDRVSAADLGHGDDPSDDADPVPPRVEEGAPAEAGGDAAAAPAGGESEPADADGAGGFVFAGDEFEATASAPDDDVEPAGDLLRGGAAKPDRPSEPDDDGESEGSGSPDAKAGKAGETADGAATAGPDADETDPEGGAEPAPEDAPTSAPEAAVEEAAAPDPSGDGESASAVGERGSGASVRVDGSPAGPPPRTIGEPSEGDSLLPRTTATVVGVVVMLVLMSLMATAIPMPFGASVGAGGVGADTVTPTDAAPGSGVAATETADATPTATDGGSGPAATDSVPTATDSPTPEPATPTTTAPSSGPSGSSGSGTATPVDTPTATPVSTPTPTPDPTPTPTDDDGLLEDPLGGLGDSL